MREPTLLECLFIYENNKYGQPINRTNKLYWKGIRYLCKKVIKKIWKIILKGLELGFQYLIPTIIAYILLKLNLFQS